MHLLVVLFVSGCSTATLCVGAVLTGGTPAFQATIEMGSSVGTKRLYEITHEHGVQSGRDGVAYVGAFNADVVTLHDERGPVARIGPRIRGVSTGGGSIGARGTFYTGMLRDPKTRSGGIGVELAGGIPFEGVEPVIEASIVLTSKWSIN